MLAAYFAAAARTHAVTGVRPEPDGPRRSEPPAQGKKALSPRLKTAELRPKFPAQRLPFEMWWKR